MSKNVKRCLYCGQLYKPINIWQKYCRECDADRVRAFKDSREFRTCKICKSVFLSIDGAELCDRCEMYMKGRV